MPHDGESAVFYFHPWEIDTGQPRIAGIDRKTRFRHYVNIHRMERRLHSLLGDFKWGRMDHLFLHRARWQAGTLRHGAPCDIQRLDRRRRSRAPHAGTPSCSAARRPPSFTAPAGRRSCARSSGTTPTTCTPQVDGRIDGVLPLAHVNSLLFGNALVSLPFAVYGGVAASNDEAAQALEQEAQQLAQRLGVAHLELRHVQPRHTDWPRQDLYVTFRKPILADEEANMLAIPRKQRAMVRKGIKNGLRSDIDADVDRFFALYADNVHRHGTPALPKRYFQALCESSAPIAKC